MTIAAGTKLGRYEIRSQLGAGGMGEVYLARDVEIGRDVALKVLPSTFSSDKDRLQRFQQEACAAGAHDAAVEIGNAQALFETRIWPPPGTYYDVTRDGKRFLIDVAGESSSVPIMLMVNWTAELKR
jgi:hypothetical protein